MHTLRLRSRRRICDFATGERIVPNRYDHFRRIKAATIGRLFDINDLDVVMERKPGVDVVLEILGVPLPASERRLVLDE